VKSKLQEEVVGADSKAKLLHDAEKYMLHGKVQQAISEYQKIVKSDPNDVLILNTIGDLYLRQGNSSEANKCFAQVAENYVRNNFFLKAIAVYKKILNSEGDNLDINLTVASLCARQGLNIEARNQYMRIAAIYEKDGKAQETADIYEKIVELDPGNAAIQRKLADLHLAQNSQKSKDKAKFYFAGAGRALFKAGNYAAALDCFQQVMHINPMDSESMKGLMECCTKAGALSPALDQLNQSLDLAPDNLDFREMLGRAYLANNQIDLALEAFQRIMSVDESRYPNYFDVAHKYIDMEDYDRSANSLDAIVPILISRRETDRAVQLYEKILQLKPSHIPSLIKLASMFFAIDDHGRYFKTIETIAERCLKENRPIEALEYVEKALQIEPENDKYLAQHQKVFAQAYPGVPYAAPAALQEKTSRSAASDSYSDAAAKGETSLVEIDLMLNYGMKEKALHLLQGLEASDPANKEVRSRLYTMFKDEGQNTKAAEQSLLLVVLCRKSMDEESAQRYWIAAQELDPELVSREQDLESFARRRGILLELPGSSSLSSGSEVDLSGDLLDIFFSGNQEAVPSEESEPITIPDTSSDVFVQDVPAAQPAAKSLHEQLQEVDFYIRLGFNDEALNKLDEIAKIDPENPELVSRYQKLGKGDLQASIPETPVKPAPQSPVEAPIPFHVPELSIADEIKGLPDFEIDEVLSKLGESRPDDLQFSAFDLEPESEKPAGTPFDLNDMFSDLSEEVAAISDQDISKESFENHFGLGTAYREMDLTDDAIKEFEIALRALDSDRDPKKVIQCCGMLSVCYLTKGTPKSAINWCQKGLSVPDLSSREALAFRYDIGLAHIMSGDANQAIELFEGIFKVDPGYRDVAQKLDELKGVSKPHVP
jgi:tetratricopeptide (TPR) repeat protein